MYRRKGVIKNLSNKIDSNIEFDSCNVLGECVWVICVCQPLILFASIFSHTHSNTARTIYPCDFSCSENGLLSLSISISRLYPKHFICGCLFSSPAWLCLYVRTSVSPLFPTTWFMHIIFAFGLYLYHMQIYMCYVESDRDTQVERKSMSFLLS